MKKLLLIFLFIMPFIVKAPSFEGKAKVDKFSLDFAMIREMMIEQRIGEIKESEFTYNLLKEYVELVDPTLSDVPIRQFILETGWFTSKLFLEYNNIAGMKLAKVRETTAVGKALGHAMYDHWTDSVDDYIHWKRYWEKRGYNSEDYYAFLKEIGYATFSGYERRLKSINLEV